MELCFACVRLRRLPVYDVQSATPAVGARYSLRDVPRLSQCDRTGAVAGDDGAAARDGNDASGQHFCVADERVYELPTLWATMARAVSVEVS